MPKINGFASYDNLTKAFWQLLISKFIQKSFLITMKDWYAEGLMYVHVMR